MGSRISRGASEWSGDKENIYGKYFQGYRKSSDFIGIVPEGSRMFRRVPWWGPLVQNVPHGPRGGAPALHGPGAQPHLVHAHGIRDKAKSLENRGRLGGQVLFTVTVHGGLFLLLQVSSSI